jgi:predicted nucleic acid-binding protein
MKLVLDASVAIAAMRPDEPAHVASRARIERALQGADELVEPPLFRVEVAGALARRGVADADIRALLQALRAPPHRIVTIGPKGSASAETCALLGRLRGADAVYVWLASARGLPLCTLDQEMAQRGAAFCTVIGP